MKYILAKPILSWRLCATLVGPPAGNGIEGELFQGER
jgi:hypothetical protein